MINVSTIKPLNESEVFTYTAGVQKAFTVEEHNVIGGLGGAMAEVLSSRVGPPHWFGWACGMCSVNPDWPTSSSKSMVCSRRDWSGQSSVRFSKPFRAGRHDLSEG